MRYTLESLINNHLKHQSQTAYICINYTYFVKNIIKNIQIIYLEAIKY